MKKFLVILLVVIIGILLIFGIRLGLGFGLGNGLGTETNDVSTESETETVEEKEAETETEPEGIVFSITVVESEYFYDNNRIELSSFVDIVKASSEHVVVEIKEDKASLKAYNKLIETLEELDVEYVAK